MAYRIDKKITLQISADFETALYKVCAYLPDLPTPLKLRRDTLRRSHPALKRLSAG